MSNDVTPLTTIGRKTLGDSIENIFCHKFIHMGGSQKYLTSWRYFSILPEAVQPSVATEQRSLSVSVVDSESTKRVEMLIIQIFPRSWWWRARSLGGGSRMWELCQHRFRHSGRSQIFSCRSLCQIFSGHYLDCDDGWREWVMLHCMLSMLMMKVVR